MTSVEIATILLRCTVGGFMIPHGLQKFGILGGDRALEIKAFEELGLRPGPPWVNFSGVAQVILGLLLVLGLFTEVTAAVTVAFMVAAAVIGLRNNGWYWQNHGMEYAYFWALAALCVFFLGAGPWSLDQTLQVAG